MKCFRFLIFFSACFSTALWAEDRILNLYSWAGFFPEAVLQEFEKETGIHVNFSSYANNESLYAKLKANPDSGYDIVVPSTYFIDRMVRQNLIQKLDKSKLANISALDPTFLGREDDPKDEYSVPFLWGATGIVVNTRYHAVADLKIWDDLWKPRYRDQLLALDDTREMFSIALITLGYSVNDQDPEHIEAAFEKLKLLMPNIKLFNLDAVRSIYLDEDITLGVGWSGDAYLAQQENPRLEFIYPADGFIISLDSLAIPTGAKHVENAHRFIDFVLRPEIAMAISLGTGFSTANQAAVKLLPEKIRNNPTIYPSAKILKGARFQTDAGNAAPLYEKYFERLKLEH